MTAFGIGEGVDFNFKMANDSFGAGLTRGVNGDLAKSSSGSTFAMAARAASEALRYTGLGGTVVKVTRSLKRADEESSWIASGTSALLICGAPVELSNGGCDGVSGPSSKTIFFFFVTSLDEDGGLAGVRGIRYVPEPMRCYEGRHR